MKSARAALYMLVLVTAACKSGRPIPLIRPELPPRSAEKLLERVLANQSESARYYSAKAAVEIVIDGDSKSFKAQVRSVQDSAAMLSVIPALGIEVARLLITRDSVKVMDKLHDQYFVGDTAAAKKRFGIPPSLALFQQALQGRAIDLDPEEKYRSEREDGLYVLTSREKRRFVRAAEDLQPGDTLARDRDMGERRLERTLRRAEEREAIVRRYWIEPDSFRVVRVQVTDLVHDRTADIRYEEKSGPELKHMPTRLRITLSEPGRLVSSSMDITRLDLEGPLNLNFKIPEKYEPMP
ncbi:MAG: DUF4292 domain-containing protein [Flavobacteriales bacterium]|nr:DUF4292 domain-containing protein [Flavobacteriales bacterium]